jgi:FtsH-binding integral membrane protein
VLIVCRTNEIQQHLAKVYSTLLLTSIAASVGVYVQGLFNLQSFLYSLIGFGCLFYVGFTQHTKSNVPKRLAALTGFGFLQGLSIGPLVNMALQIDQSIVGYALFATLAVFASFSLCALFAQRRSMLFLGGIFSSFFNLLFWSYLMNFFFRSSFPFMLNLYGGLFVFALYVVYDTQLTIERRFSGDDDFIKHSLDLFLDLVSLFIRILIILLKNKEKKSKSQSRN